MKFLVSTLFVMLFAQSGHALKLLPNSNCPNKGEKKIYECKVIPNSGSAANVLRSIHICNGYYKPANMLIEDGDGKWWEETGDAVYTELPDYMIYTKEFDNSDRYSILIPRKQTSGIVADFEYYSLTQDLGHQNSQYTCEKVN